MHADLGLLTALGNWTPQYSINASSNRSHAIWTLSILTSKYHLSPRFLQDKLIKPSMIIQGPVHHASIVCCFGDKDPEYKPWCLNITTRRHSIFRELHNWYAINSTSNNIHGLNAINAPHQCVASPILLHNESWLFKAPTHHVAIVGRQFLQGIGERLSGIGLPRRIRTSNTKNGRTPHCHLYSKS